MLTQCEVEEILAGSRELRNFLVKGPGSRTDPLFTAKVIRATPRTSLSREEQARLPPGRRGAGLGEPRVSRGCGPRRRSKLGKEQPGSRAGARVAS